MDANVIDDGIVGIGQKVNEEIEDKLETELSDNYIIVGGTKWISM